MHYRELDDAWRELTASGAEFEVLTERVRGVTIRTYKNAPASVRDFWRATHIHGDRDYLVYRDERISYRRAHALVASVANWLADRGVGKGDRVAIAMRNYPEWLLIYWACLSSGVTVVGMNAWWVSDEMSFAIQDARPKVIFCDAERLEVLRDCALDPRMSVVGVRCDDLEGVVDWHGVAGFGGDLPDTEVHPDDDACIFYTSGTTGRPKGAMLTHRGCIANLMNLQFASRAQARAQELAGKAPDITTTIPVSLVTTPLFHVSANNCVAYLTTAAGGKLVLMHRWDTAEALSLVAQEKVTSLRGVPVMSREIINHPERHRYDLSSLVSMGGGGAPLPPDLVVRISDAAIAPSTAYGLTETSGIITGIDAMFFADKPTSVGRAMPTFEARLVDGDGQDAPAHGLGELWVRGAPVIKEYINRPDATADAITDGWFHTGDIARIDAEGFLHIVDRKKDMVLRGGENVYCAEVEACLYRHDDVAECSVFGVEDDRLGEEVAAAVVLRPGAELTAEALS